MSTYELLQQEPSVYLPVILISFVCTLIGYGLFPVVFAKARKTPITRKKYTWTCFGVNLLVMLIFIALGSNGSGGPYALWTWCFSSYGKKALKTKGLLDATNVNSPKTSSASNVSSDHAENTIGRNEDIQTYSLSQEEPAETHKTGSYNVYGAGISLDKNYQTSKTTTQETPPAAEKTNQKFCSRCGNKIDAATKKCTGCGKQYFKGISWRTALLAVTVVLLIVSCGLNVMLYSKTTTIQEEINALNTTNEKLKKENSTIKKDLNAYREQIEFFDEFVVFVEDDGTDLYHKYECNRFIGNHFWAYNIDAAEDEGYHPCPLCSSTNPVLNALAKDAD